MKQYRHGVYVHFELSEFACRCGECDSDGSEMQPGFIRKLDDLRERCGFPFRITSGYRCPAYNARISSTGEDGPHTTGRAADVGISGPRVNKLVHLASAHDCMKGVGINQRGDHAGRFVHLDDLTEPKHPRPRVWTY